MKRYLTEREVVMIFETLKRSHLKRNIMIVSVIVVIISVCIFNFTRAKYRYTQSIPLVNGIINYSLADLNIIALYQQNDSGVMMRFLLCQRLDLLLMKKKVIVR